MNSLRAELVVRGSSEWDEYVGAHPAACFSHTTAWRDVIQKTYGHRPYYLAAMDGGSIRGVLGLFLVRCPGLPGVLASAPYASEGSVCADGPEEALLLIDAAKSLARRLRVGYLELKSTSPSPAGDLRSSNEYCTYRLSLDEPDTMWRDLLKGSTRTRLRKADKVGVTCTEGPEMLDDFYGILAHNMRRLGTPVHAKRFYENILGYFGDRARLIVAHHEGRPVATSLCLRHRDVVSCLCQATLFSARSVSPGDMACWHAIRRAHADAASTFDLGRSIKGSGPATWKERWSAKAVPLHYEYFLQGAKSVPKLNQANPRLRLLQRLWMRMPLLGTKVIGSYLIRWVV